MWEVEKKMADRRRRPHSEAESDEESTETGSTQSPRKPRQSECVSSHMKTQLNNKSIHENRLFFANESN